MLSVDSQQGYEHEWIGLSFSRKKETSMHVIVHVVEEKSQ